MATGGRPGRVLVIGGGIAGLAAARALGRQGVDCDVVERAASWHHPGAGLYLPANATRALDRLGLRDRVLERARPIDRQRFLDHSGRVLLDVELADVWGSTGRCLAVAREDLHEVMRERVPVRLGMTVTAVHDDGTGVQADFADGSSARFDLALGADGLRSWLRTTLFGRSGVEFLGQVCWRFIVDGFPQIPTWTVWLGRKRGFLVVPIGAGRLYCYADVDSAEPTDPGPALAELFGRFAEPVPTIVAAWLGTGLPAHVAPIEEVVHEPWVRGRVALIGDAAHGMSPNMAEGVGLALEDALVLAETVAAGRPLDDFEARRRPRVAFVRAQARRRDRTRHLPDRVRNVALRFAGRRIVRGGYAALRAEP